jgi:Rieske Fe-S protein
MRLRESLFSRRRFLNGIVGAGWSAMLVYLLYPLCRFVWGASEVEPESVVLKDFTEPAPGEAAYFKYGPRPAFIFRTTTGELRAFTAVCSHLNCTVQYDAQHRRIWCACHEGIFDLDGKNVSGPPPRPLRRYYLERRGRDICVALQKPATPKP